MSVPSLNTTYVLAVIGSIVTLALSQWETVSAEEESGTLQELDPHGLTDPG